MKEFISESKESKTENYDMLDEFNCLTLKILCRTAMGVDLGKENPGTDSRDYGSANWGPSLEGFRVKHRNFVFPLFFQSTDVPTGVRKAKSRHDMDTAGVRVEIISLCMFTELLRFDTVT